jgi:hypothetical protein
LREHRPHLAGGGVAAEAVAEPTNLAERITVRKIIYRTIIL